MDLRKFFKLDDIEESYQIASDESWRTTLPQHIRREAAHQTQHITVVIPTGIALQLAKDIEELKALRSKPPDDS